MLFDEMISIAQNVAFQQGGRLGFNDTICIARTVSGKIVIGISSSMMVNNVSMNIHAEVDLCNKLITDNDTAISEMCLVGATNLMPVLPCGECVGRLISLHPYNASAVLILPDQCVPLSQMGTFMQNPAMPQPNMGMNNPYAGGQAMNQMGGYPQPTPYRPADQQSMSLDQLHAASPVPASRLNMSRPVSAYAGEQKSDDSTLLKNRLNKLFDEDEAEAEAEEVSEKPKKKFKFFK